MRLIYEVKRCDLKMVECESFAKSTTLKVGSRAGDMRGETRNYHYYRRN